jgi:dihydropteroate synthase
MTQLVGILNVTPDSFSDGGQFYDADMAVEQAAKLFRDGAALVDIGAESTRPGATQLSPEQEWRRLEPVLKRLLDQFPGRLSVDTHRPETVERVLGLGSGDLMINDVTGMNNPDMVEAVSGRKARCIISHLPGADIQTAHRGPLVDDEQQVINDLLARAELLIAKGLPKSSIILDPGIGFGKTMELNQRLLRFAEKVPDYPVMIGYSRKRFLGEQRMELAPNLQAGRIAIAAGAAYLRVHDVAAHRQLIY